LEEPPVPILSSTCLGEADALGMWNVRTSTHGVTSLKSLFYMVNWLGIEFISRQFSATPFIQTQQHQPPI